MFGTILSLIPDPRQADQPRHYVGRHRVSETIIARATVAVPPATSDATPAARTEAGIEAEVPAVG
jgi:hypothetical protein